MINLNDMKRTNEEEEEVSDENNWKTTTLTDTNDDEDDVADIFLFLTALTAWQLYARFHILEFTLDTC